MPLLHPPPFSAMCIHFGCQSLTTVQLRSSRGQPTARVCLCCFKGSHQGMVLNNCCIYAKGFRMVSTDLKPPKDFIKRGSYPLIIFKFICVVGVIARCVVGMEEHPQSVPPCRRQDAAQQLCFVMSMPLPRLPHALSESQWKRIHCSLVIQQTHSSVSALTITSRRSLPNGRCQTKGNNNASIVRGLQKQGKGGDSGKVEGGREGIDIHSSLLLSVILIDGKRGPKTDGRQTLSAGNLHKPRWKLTSTQCPLDSKHHLVSMALLCRHLAHHHLH